MFNSIKQAIQAIKRGEMVIVVDDETRENEGDLIMAARYITPEKLTFLHDKGRGLVCVPMEKARAKKLNLWPIVPDELNTEFTKCKFMVSVDKKSKVKSQKSKLLNEYKTGVSTLARVLTIKTLGDARATADDFTRPGHISPLVAEEWGVLARDGHTEAAVDLCRLAGMHPPVGVLVEILKPNGRIARLPYLKQFAKQHRLNIITVHNLGDYRKCHEKLILRIAQANLQTVFGTFKIYAYKEKITGKEHIALTLGAIKQEEKILVRVHSRCLTGDVFHSLRCDCEEQLHKAMELIAEKGKGALVYLNQEGRDIGIVDKIKSYALQDRGYDTVQANLKLGYKPDMRMYHIGTQILRDLGVSKMELLTNNPHKIVGLEHYGLMVIKRIPLEITSNEYNREYLSAKRDKLGHILH